MESNYSCRTSNLILSRYFMFLYLLSPMRFLLAVFLFLISSFVMSGELSPSEYKDEVEHFRDRSITVDGMEETFIRESEMFRNFCESKDVLQSIHDCDCLSSQFLEKRKEYGLAESRDKILSKIRYSCIDVNNEELAMDHSSTTLDEPLPSMTEEEVIDYTKNCEKAVVWFRGDYSDKEKKYKKYVKTARNYVLNNIDLKTARVPSPLMPGSILIATGIENYSKLSKYPEFAFATVQCGQIEQSWVENSIRVVARKLNDKLVDKRLQAVDLSSPEYTDEVTHFLHRSIAFEGLEKAFVRESEIFIDYCKSQGTLKAHHNCECLSSKFLEKRSEYGLDASRKKVLANIGRDCVDVSDEELAKQYRQCKSNGLLLPKKIDATVYCTCYANEYADVFEKNRYRADAKSINRAQTLAVSRCSKASYAIDKYGQVKPPL